MTRRCWTLEEDEIVRREYPKGDTWLLAKRLKRSKHALIKRAWWLGLKKEFRSSQQTRVWNNIIKNQRKAGFL